MMSVTEIENMRALRGWLLALVLAALAVVISYYWLDRPIALFVHSQFPRNIRVLLEPVTYIPNPLIWLATITFLAFGIRGLAGRSSATHLFDRYVGRSCWSCGEQL